MALKNLHDLWVEQLQDIYSAETQLIDALPKMAKAASSSDLQNAFNMHLDQTKQHRQRLEQVFQMIDANPKGKKCKGMEGLIKEGEEMIDEKADSDVRDAGLIAAAQRVEHYEIAAYGTVCALAKQLGETDADQLLQQTLQEEKNTDQKLTKIAEGHVNKQAQS